MKVHLKNVRVAFLNCHEPKAVNGEGDPRYSVVPIIEPGSANAKAVEAAVNAVAKEKWKDKATAILAKLYKDGRVCYHKEPKANADGEVYEGFADMHSLTASNKARPLVIDRDKSPLTQADGKPYSGCYANVSVDIWPQDNSFGRRINASFKGVQYVGEGDAFGGGAPASADEFDDLGGDDTESDLS